MARIFRRRGPDGDLIKVWYCWVPDPITGSTRRVSTKCTDKVAAQKRADELEREAVDPDSAAQAKATLRDAFELLIRDRASMAKAGKRSDETVKFYEKKAGILLGAVPEVLGHEEGADVFLREVSGRLVDDYIILRRDDGVAESTIQKELTTWRIAMRLAKRRRLWKGDLEETFPKFSAEYKPRERFVEPHEIGPLRAAFLRETDGEANAYGRAFWAITAFSIATSAEWSSLWRARRDDIDKSDPLVWFVHVHGSKNNRRDREVPVAYLPFAYLLEETLVHADGELGLFLNREANFRTRLTEACRRAGIPHLSPNDLRRTHGKWLRLAGVTPATIGTSLGHVDARMAERVYAKATARELARVHVAELDPARGLLMGSDAGKSADSRPNPTTTETEEPQ